MLSKLTKNDKLMWAEDSRVVVEIRRLCVRSLNRPMLIPGGSVKLWGHTNSWDQLVDKCVALGRVHGILSITGDSYFSLFEQGTDGCHSKHAEKNGFRYAKFFEER